MIWNYLHYKNKASPLRQLPRPAPFPLHGSPLRRAACAMLTIASSEPSFHSLSAGLGVIEGNTRLLTFIQQNESLGTVIAELRLFVG